MKTREQLKRALESAITDGAGVRAFDAAILEVLLDIRDLLTPLQDKKDGI